MFAFVAWGGEVKDDIILMSLLWEGNSKTAF